MSQGFYAMSNFPSVIKVKYQCIEIQYTVPKAFLEENTGQQASDNQTDQKDSKQATKGMVVNIKYMLNCRTKTKWELKYWHVIAIALSVYLQHNYFNERMGKTYKKLTF